MDPLSKYDVAIEYAVDEWLGENEGFSLRAERIPDGALPWLYEAARVGAKLVIENDVEGLQADLDSAIRVAWVRGAHDWVRDNYPKHYERFVHGE